MDLRLSQLCVVEEESGLSGTAAISDSLALIFASNSRAGNVRFLLKGHSCGLGGVFGGRLRCHGDCGDLPAAKQLVRYRLIGRYGLTKS